MGINTYYSLLMTDWDCTVHQNIYQYIIIRSTSLGQFYSLLELCPSTNVQQLYHFFLALLHCYRARCRPIRPLSPALFLTGCLFFSLFLVSIHTAQEFWEVRPLLFTLSFPLHHMIQSNNPDTFPTDSHHHKFTSAVVAWYERWAINIQGRDKGNLFKATYCLDRIQLSNALEKQPS